MTTSVEYRSIVSGWMTWARTNLFNSWPNSVLSLAAIGVGGIVAFLILKFVLFQANWGLVAINRKLFFIGSYPAEDMFRIWLSLFIVVILIALTYGVLDRKIAALHRGDRRSSGDNPRPWLGHGVAHRGATVHRGEYSPLIRPPSLVASRDS